MQTRTTEMDADQNLISKATRIKTKTKAIDILIRRKQNSTPHHKYYITEHKQTVHFKQNIKNFEKIKKRREKRMAIHLKSVSLSVLRV